MPNLSSTDCEQSYEIDAQALSNVLWSISRKIDDFDKKFAAVVNKIEHMDEYLQNRITEQFSILEKRLNLSNDSCERSQKASHDILLAKIEDSANDNEVLRTQWKAHMERLKANIELMEDNRDESDSESEEDENDVNRRRYRRTIGDGATADQKVEELEKVVEKLNERIFELDCRVVECEQYSRRENLVITGIPESVDDIRKLESTIITTLGKLGIYIELKDISACHRLGPYQHHARYPRSVIVRFINRKIVHHALDNREKLWGLKDVLNMNLRFYESLCSLNNETRKLCNNLKQNGEIHSFSIKHGFVSIVTNNGDRPVKIRHPELLKKRFAIE